MKATNAQFDAVFVRPFVIFFISSILSILCGIFFFFGLGGGERGRGGGGGVAAYGYRILYLHLPHCSVRYTVKITAKISAGCESDFA
jgi:hypothetical protein